MIYLLVVDGVSWRVLLEEWRGDREVRGEEVSFGQDIF